MMARPPLGSVYGVILNDQHSLAILASQLEQAPYQAPPKAPVLYIKPRNTLVDSGSSITLPKGEHRVEVGTSLGLVIGKPASRVNAEQALEHIAGVMSVADLSLPHDSYYRPAIREKCFDGACPMATHLSPWSEVQHLMPLSLHTLIHGQLVATRSIGDALRSIPQLLQDVSEFMTLNRGDVLLIGVPYRAPQAQSGDNVQISIEGLEPLHFKVEAAA